MVGGLLFGIFAIFLFLGVPIAICLGLASTVTLMVLGDVPLAAIVQRMYSATDSFPMMAIPHSIDGGCFGLFFAVFQSTRRFQMAAFLHSLHRFQAA